LLLISIVSGLLFSLLLVAPPALYLRCLCKVLSILPLLLLPLLTPGAPRRGGLALALAFALTGDICLTFPGATWFLRGLLAFLGMQLLYIYLFSRRVRRPLRLTAAELLGSALIIGGALAALSWLWPGLGVMRLPVLVYASALTSMNVAALLCGLPGLLTGTLLFLVSDTLIGVWRFVGPLPGAAQLIWVTYYAAQLLIVCSYLAAPPRAERPPGAV
jgi:uncharacterized membrane protein YhhN